MEYLVRFMPRAERDLAALFESIDAQNSDAAFDWYLKLEEAILALETNPRRCPQTPESEDLRHLLYGKKPHVYRVIYRIVEKKWKVEILHIRHGARDSFNPDTL